MLFWMYVHKAYFVMAISPFIWPKQPFKRTPPGGMVTARKASAASARIRLKRRSGAVFQKGISVSALEKLFHGAIQCLGYQLGGIRFGNAVTRFVGLICPP